MIGIREFRKIAAEALSKIPEEFLEKLENVEVWVEEEPDPEMLEELGLDPRETLFGIYQGLPRGEQSFFQAQVLPNRITLFRRPILEVCQNRDEIQEQIRKTVIHEIAHHFGFSEKRLRELGYG
ncbi:MAG: metallopeptidase family protein [Deltaproteobacteria bacterium]|nr:metallopeptidase family protein [Deltaproteobacteria bacterium]